MLDIINTNNLREQLLYELNHSKPETLEIVYYFMQTLKKSFKEKKETKGEHYLAKFAGSIDKESAIEMMNCINNEFNLIEGEW